MSKNNKGKLNKQSKQSKQKRKKQLFAIIGLLLAAAMLVTTFVSALFVY